MKTKIYHLLVCIAGLLCLYACDDEKNNSEVVMLPRIMTVAPTDIKATSVLAGGHVMSDGGGNITERGVCWATTESPTTDNDKKLCGTGKGTFQHVITGLVPGKTYNIRAFVTNEKGVVYGEEYTITTKNPTLATVVSAHVTNAFGATAISGGNVTKDGDDVISARGVCWSTDHNPTIEDNKTVDGTGTGEFISTLTGLTPEVTYYLRAYATNFAGTAYGEEISFSTIQPVLPTLSTLSVTDITSTTAKSGGNVTLDGGAAVTARGICWSTTKEPTLADNYTVDGAGMGAFSSERSGLQAGKVYHVRAYATNEIGTQYGNEILFTPSYVDDGLDMILMESATFLMGGNDGNESGPTFLVSVPAFYLSKVETTQKLWVEVMNYNPTCTDCPSPVDDYYPVSNITWYDAIVFCNKLSFLKGLSPCYSINGETDPDNWIYQNNIEERVVCDWNAKGYRLPNEAEWEYAAGGGAEHRTKYAGTDDYSELQLYGWIEGTTDSLKKIATKLPNSLGFYDMNGNVAEHCWEWHTAYTETPKNYPNDIPVQWGQYAKIKRGGSIWNWGGTVYLTYSRWVQPPSERAWPTGLRLARTK